MQEVTKQLGPLAERVATLSNSIERLYNSNGGPPGYLQNARAEDNGRFEMIFAILNEHKEEIKPITDYIRSDEVREQQRKDDQEALEKKYNLRLVVLGLLLTAIMAFSPNLQGCKHAASTLLEPPPAHSQLQMNSGGLPPVHY